MKVSEHWEYVISGIGRLDQPVSITKEVPMGMELDVPGIKGLGWSKGPYVQRRRVEVHEWEVLT